MPLSTTITILRSLLCLANFFLVLVGLFVLVTGFWIVFDPSNFHIIVVQDMKEDIKQKIEEFASDFTQVKHILKFCSSAYNDHYKH